jgi:hypothetical protein
MTLGFVASLVASALIGLLTISCAWGRPAGLSQFRLWLGFLAVGIGLGLSSSVFFVWLSLGAPSAMFPLGELGMVIVLASVAFYARKLRHSRAPLPVRGASPVAPTNYPLLSLVLWLSVGCATIAFLVQSVTSQQGGWDAWMTWNMHARAIFRGGDHWREVLTGLPDWSHPDYPLLVPGSVARMWTYMGGETPLAPASVAMLFTFATVGLLYSSVSILRSRTQGCLAALLLLGTKFFIVHGASQYADVPFGFFLLATLVLLALTEVWPDDRPCLLALAGVTVGLSAWTKNEGLLLLLAVLVGYGLVIVRARGWHTGLRDARAFAIGLAPVFAVVVYFKIWVAPPNDLMSAQGFRQTAERLLEGSRYLQVLTGVGQGFLEISPKGVIGLLLLAYWLCAGPAEAGPSRLGAKTTAIVLSLILVGYATVLLAAPAPLLATNIRSINRLLLQLWPSTLFAYFLMVRTAEEAGVVGQRLSQPEAVPRRSGRPLVPLSEAS